MAITLHLIINAPPSECRGGMDSPCPYETSECVRGDGQSLSIPGQNPCFYMKNTLFGRKKSPCGQLRHSHTRVLRENYFFGRKKSPCGQLRHRNTLVLRGKHPRSAGGGMDRACPHTCRPPGDNYELQSTCFCNHFEQCFNCCSNNCFLSEKCAHEAASPGTS